MEPRHRYVFVGGLHRSGTSLTARLLARHPSISGIEGAPVPENEGVYLQGAIPHTARHGIPCHFATDPAQHLIEGCVHDRLETRIRLEADWAPWFEPDAPWRVEKSPVNLTRMRLYQQLFPLSQFVVVLRHPQAVAAAMAKWTGRPVHELVAHWIEAHDRLLSDLPHLHAVMVMRYEDLAADPAGCAARLHAFLDLPASGAVMEEDIRDGNLDYASAAKPMEAEMARAVSRWGYSDALRADPSYRGELRHPLRRVAEAAGAA
ncbi:sulfotransferase family protein [Profundibacterium mesophilum]|uniref:Sulfotransferase familydomain containing protein n=1 Tax=Profundibacterium mesophilum KAUST100406-0324 TaxID=1037889 RepID=A0A921NSZ5_9RHOB|nr:sulfotransferase [Profundibacterium mesophilum]KAF0676009.1 Sulfotransferase familydomain containing protein [Profundibacterium mesophilum KAUST100406-0324]